MKKSDLKTGMRVRVRIGGIYLVIKDIQHADMHQELAFINETGFLKGSNYDDNLTHTLGYSNNYDIMEVYIIEEKRPYSLLTTNILNLDKKHSIWKRQEYTEEHKKIINALRVLGFNYVARDESNDLYAFEIKPVKRLNFKNWNVEAVSYDYCMELTGNNKKVFDFVKWEDEKPFEIPTL